MVLRGEAGIGKTALLEYLIESAADMAVVRAVGVESEMELAYASLHQLCGRPSARASPGNGYWSSKPRQRGTWRLAAGGRGSTSS
jgi:hypothetical protein